MVWGAIIAGAAGALGGAIKQNSVNKKQNSIMRQIGDRRFGYERLHGDSQDALARTLAKGGFDQSTAQAAMDRTDINRDARVAEAGGAAGIRDSMFRDSDEKLASVLGKNVAAERTSNMADAGRVMTQTEADMLRRKQLRLEAAGMYEDARGKKGSVLKGAVSGAASALSGMFGK